MNDLNFVSLIEEDMPKRQRVLALRVILNEERLKY